MSTANSAQATAAAENQIFGGDGDDTNLDRRERRLATLQAAPARIGPEAADKARRHAEDKECLHQQRTGEGMGRPWPLTARPRQPDLPLRGCWDIDDHAGTGVWRGVTLAP